MATGSKPPHAAPSGTRWSKGSDGKWMLHETDPEGWYRKMRVKGKSKKEVEKLLAKKLKNKKNKTA